MPIETIFDPTLLLAADLDDDGRAEVVTVHALAGALAILRADGAGGLALDAEHTTPGIPFSGSIFDLDQDGALDILVATPETDLGPGVCLGEFPALAGRWYYLFFSVGSGWNHANLECSTNVRGDEEHGEKYSDFRAERQR